ncbi:serine-protein kinase ATM-like isoform X2 [Mya arenaria]|uniref:serine-protein kinase ATM-like isoform X2 n=1 Tax=Mya arenaria TaxID=6604 RepID=UPI0022E4437E|nr:serine-protein kinase ATM-like isoform X2 [Mya arenaria]
MDRQTSDLINLCRAVNSERGPERRKAAVKLINSLHQSGVKKSLDKNFEIKALEGKKARVFTWENVFRAVCLYVQLETEELQKANENVSKATKTGRETRKKDISGLVKTVIRAADKGSPKLKGSLLFEHIKTVLMELFSCDAYGQDYCSIMLKNVLTVRKYVVELTTEELHKLLFLFCKLFCDPDVKLDRLVLARIIHSLVTSLSTQADIRPKRILAFFTDFFLKSKQHKSGLIVQHLLSALNVLVGTITPTSRVQVCRLGEDIVHHLLYLWHNIATEELKDCLLEFLQVQVWCHHPRGDKQGGGGAFAVNWDTWMSHLRKLYDLMYSEIQQIGAKSRAKDSILKPAFVNLAVDVCQQIFTEGSHTIEVTQLSLPENEEEGTQPGPRPKRRRLESGWEAIRGFIITSGQTAKLIPWLQLVTGILDKHPSSFPQDETLPYLTCLSQIVGDCKRADLMNHVQRCIRAFVSNWDKVLGESSTDNTQQLAKTHWNQIWMASLRFVSLHNTEPEGYLLLSAMISQGLVTPRRDLWSLFVPSISQPITESVQFLCQLLTSCDLPEQLVPSLVISVPSQTGNTSFPLRKQLIDWLFPSREEEGESSRSFKLNPDWTAKALVALTLNDPSGVKIDLFVKKGAISDIERIYLQTCLELPLQANKNLVPKKNIEKTSDSAHLSTLLNVVENMIKQEVQYLCSRSDEQAPNILEAVNFCQLISNILFQLLSQNIFTTATVSHSNLYTHLVTLMKKISKCLHDIVKKDGAAGTGSVIEALGRLFDWSLCEAELGGVMACLCRAATPAQLTDVLMDIAADKHSKENNHAHISDASLKESRFERSRSRVLDLDDDEFDLDLESEGTSNRNNNNMEVDDLDFDVEIETQDSDDSSINVEVSQSLLTAQLNEAQTLRMLAVCSLCAWCTHSRASTRELKLKPEMDLKYLKNKLVGLLSDETLDPKRIFDLQMMVKITSQLTDVTENLTTKELLVIVTAIRLCVSAHRKDQEVCVASLELMIRLVPHLSDSDNVSSSTLREAQSIVLVLANAFWRLETYASPVRRKLAVLMETLHEHDPEVRWSRFKSEEEENSPDSQGASGPTPGERFINCLADDCLLVRSQTTQAIHKLFIQCQKPVTRSTQEEMFALIYKELSELVDICLPATMTPDRKQDFSEAVDSSLLLSIGGVICHSGVCEKVALFSLLQFIQEKHLAVHKVCKLVGKVSTFLGYTSLEQFVTSHLPYLIHRWLQLEFPIKKFPYHLLNCSDRTQFYRDHLDALIPELVVFKALPAIKEISVSLGATHKDILQSLIPRIVTHILPVFATGKKKAQASAAYDLLVEEISQQVLERQIVNNLDEIVVNILGCLHDTDSDIGPIRDTNPEPNPPFYNTLAVTSTLDYITRSFAGKDKSLVEILSKTTDSLQKILLKLSSSLWASHRVSEKRRVLSMYQLFTGLLLRHFHTELGGCWAFVLRDMLTRLIYLVREMLAIHDLSGVESSYRENIACSALQLLMEISTVAVDCCSKEFQKYLGLLAGNLVPIVEMEGDIGEQSLRLLKFLILEKAGELRTGIASLDNFPDRLVFKECRAMHHKLKYATGPFILKQEVEHFLSADHFLTLDGSLRLEGLHFLCDQLLEARNQLHVLARDDTMLRLVCKLVELSRCDDESVAMVAGRCLGVMGPVDMKTICFPSPPTHPSLQMALTCFEEVPSVHKYCNIFHKLNEYLTDKSMSVVQCASTVLKELLSVSNGVDFAAAYKVKLGDMEYLFKYLHPFRASKKRAVHVNVPGANWEVFQSTVDMDDLWNPADCCHDNWIISLTTTLINSGAVRDEILQLLGPVCKIKREFCELVLPFIIHDVLVSGGDDHHEVLSRQMSRFFSDHCGQSEGRVSRCQSMTAATTSSDWKWASMNVDSVRVMLEVVQYLRQQPRPKKGRREMTPWDNNFWLDIDYLKVAMAAQYVSAHFSTLMYAEIWFDVQREKQATTRSSQSQKLSQSLSEETRLDNLSGASQTNVPIQGLLLEAYTWIGDPDGVYGCGAGRKADTSSRVCTYQHENQWDKAVVSCDIEMSQSGQGNQYELLYALQSFGTSHILSMYMQGMLGQETGTVLTSNTRELQFESAWRVGQWNLDVPNKSQGSPGFHECMYRSLRLVKEDHFSLATSSLNLARTSALLRLQGGCLDSTKQLYSAMADLQCINMVQDIATILNRKSDGTSLPLLSDTVYTDTEFAVLDPVLHMQCTSSRLLHEKLGANTLFKDVVTSLKQLAVTARQANRHQISERAIASLKQLCGSDPGLAIPCTIEEARLFWARGEQNIAKHLIRASIDKLNKLRTTDSECAKMFPKALGIYGDWLAETRSENPNIIMENYMEKTIALYEELGEDKETSVDAYLSLARYADTQYQNIVNYMRSSTFEAKQTLMRNAKEEAERLREVMGESAKDRYLRTLEKQSEIDELELSRMQEDRQLFLLKAVQNYIQCLRSGDTHNLRVFRLTSLWFNNIDNELVNSMIQGCVSSISTYKWLPLMYQLAARMDVKPHNGTTEEFLNTLNKLMYDTAVEHPHHTLFCILALANANRDTELLQQGRASKRGSRLSKSQQPDSAVEEGRVQAAKSLVQKLRQDKKVGGIIRDLEKLCDAYIQLANWGVSQYKTTTTPIPLPDALWISKLKDLKKVPVPTKDIMVKPSGDYSDVPYLVKFEPTFKLAGGINLPKIISCMGSDGSKNRQLVKGRDDLRQDAVMEQVFGMVNSLLKKDPATRKRQLHVRQYKVIPLSQRSGLLEWCEGTQPIGEYLIGSKGAHARYRPHDWPHMECRRHMASATTVEGKYKAYQQICEKFQPVFRHFFLERFAAPPVWFQRRLAYTRSIATNSIVGYILGLGDRHPQNILIDCNTAELVHIDLGVAFEQGEILPTPETVPFRLTRDIEDAMGASGVEGGFRRCCEATLEVMRHNQESLLTILEVLLYDPLHAWTISPAKAFALQHRRGGESGDTVDVGNTTSGDIMDYAENHSNRTNSATQESANKLAERVLLRLQQKLAGVEDGVQLSLNGQVNHLIQEARNPHNLSRLFPGWQPYI